MNTTDGPDDPWAGVADPIPGARTATDRNGTGEHGKAGSTGRSDGPAADPGAEPGSEPGPEADREPGERLAEEARKLAEAVAGQLGEVRRRVVEPLIHRHPEAAAHLSAAGFELMAAYRSFVADKERRWASRAAPAQRVDLDDPDDEPRT